MADGMHCPECGADIGTWAVFSAGLPTRIRCPHCRAKLRYRDIVGVSVVLAVLLVGSVAVAFSVPFHEWVPNPRLVVYCPVVLLFALWSGVELVVVWYLRNFHALTSIK